MHTAVATGLGVHEGILAHMYARERFQPSDEPLATRPKRGMRGLLGKVSQTLDRHERHP